MTGRLPNLVIAGAPKCGTTSIYAWLADHPQVCASPVKQTGFFLDSLYPLLPRISCHTHDLDAYRQYFRHARGDEAIVCEATPDYMYQETALDRLECLDPVPHLVFVLRRPSRRVYSLYQFARNNVAVLKASVSFTEYVDALLADKVPPYLRARPILGRAIEHSRYVFWVERWLERFPEGHVHVFQFEAMRNDPRGFMQRFADRFGVDSAFYNDYDFTRRNATYRVRNVKLHRLKRTLSRLARQITPDAAQRRMEGIYRTFNVAPGVPPPSEEDRATMARLDDFFRAQNHKLAAAVPLDLALWN